MAGDALIIVDVQNDFCPPTGSLAVPRGDEIVPQLNKYIERALAVGIPIFASRDWHPKPEGSRHTKHFDTWPAHCVQDSDGAKFHPGLQHVDRMIIVTKGTGEVDDGYSAFEGHLDNGETLAQALMEREITRVFVGGLATDYCVRQTVLDALNPDWRLSDKEHTRLTTEEQRAHRPGLEVVWLRDASLPVEVKPGDGEKAEHDMLAAGARAITFAQFDPTPNPSHAQTTTGKR